MFSFYQQTEITSLENRRHTLCNLAFASTKLNMCRKKSSYYEIPNNQSVDECDNHSGHLKMPPLTSTNLIPLILHF